MYTDNNWKTALILNTKLHLIIIMHTPTTPNKDFRIQRDHLCISLFTEKFMHSLINVVTKTF